MALGHVVRNRVESGACPGQTCLERRRLLMDDWAALSGRKEPVGSIHRDVDAMVTTDYSRGPDVRSRPASRGFGTGVAVDSHLYWPMDGVIGLWQVALLGAGFWLAVGVLAHAVGMMSPWPTPRGWVAFALQATGMSLMLICGWFFLTSFVAGILSLDGELLLFGLAAGGSTVAGFGLYTIGHSMERSGSS